MEAVFLVVHLIVAVGIIIMVMIQPADSGGGLLGGGGNAMPAPRRAADTLTRITTILAGLFFLTSLSLGVIAEHKSSAKSILDVNTGTVQEAPVNKDSMEEKPAKETKPVAPISE